MRKSKYICLNFGRCRLAGAALKLRVAGQNPRCPACGEPLARARSPIVRDAVGLAVVIAALAVAGAWWANGPLPRPDRASPAQAARHPSGEFFENALTAQMVDAALRGDTAEVRAAVRRGADPNARGRDGVTPLHVALLNLNQPAFVALLEVGADPNVPAANGDCAVTLAALFPDRAYLAAALKHRGNPDALDARQRTPLMLAAAAARPENVRLLLGAHAGANLSDARGDTPLIFAFQAAAPNREIVRTLLDAGARAEATNRAGLSARDYAATHDDPSLVRLLPPQ